MGVGYRRDDFRSIADSKLRDSELLLANNRYSSAHYLSGYAVEIGLKACIAKLFSTDVIPELAFVKAIYDHRPRNLVNIAGLRLDLEAQEDSDKQFAANFAIVGQWSPADRYRTIASPEAHGMVQAVGDANSGVLQWIRRHW